MGATKSGPNSQEGWDSTPQVTEWRRCVARSAAIDADDVDELEGQLREQVTELEAAGLAPDEAFLVAVKRLGSRDGIGREFAREHSGRLWKQLVLAGDADQQGSPGAGEAIVVAVLAAIVVQTARLIAGFPDELPWGLALNASLLVVPLLAAYFARRRTLSTREWLVAAAPFALAAIIVNVYPFNDGATTQLLVAAHLPVAAWLALAFPYTSGQLDSHQRRMDFVRFTGEWAIYYALLALGGGVLVALTMLILQPVGGPALPEQVALWVLPSGAAGAVIIAAWLVEAKQRVVENMAPVLTMVFTPLFAAMIVIAAAAYAATGVGRPFDRELLGILDALMIVVVGLVLYGISARDPAAPAGWMDRTQLVAVLGALALDGMVLASMFARIADLGLTPNRIAALGLNFVLLANLAGAAWWSVQFLTGRASLHRLERWQTSYIPVFAIWAAIVVVALPPMFAFA